MFDIKSQRLLFGDKDERIVRWVVRFQTPLGLCADLYSAVQLCLSKEIDPDMAIAPVAVAESDTYTEVWLR